MLGTMLYLLSASVSHVVMSNALDDVDKKLETDNLKKENKENGYKYLLPILPSIIPGVNIISAIAVVKNKNKIYKEMKDIRCRFIIDDTKLEDTYNKANDKELEKIQKDLGDLSIFMETKKDEVMETIKYRHDPSYREEVLKDNDIVFYEYNKDSNKLEVYTDDYLDEKPKMKVR